MPSLKQFLDKGSSERFTARLGLTVFAPESEDNDESDDDDEVEIGAMNKNFNDPITMQPMKIPMKKWAQRAHHNCNVVLRQVGLTARNANITTTRTLSPNTSNTMAAM